ncbi:uncharacterized protein PHALS_11463 [Plasmopara halstedii]|uniref:Uncharacterized protein n=1 Tax=Plasmopara halstedii TaxID=4781 RepID=A0A0P1A627_PLAHL|nr:uncharacterized protein PHALS_11463 [Plasmopara halstedii]CEG35592.1 hypothetical protein PHALS_11463 [Plasmopara halstedii]|eukprot:XP_024571961.1 hypothetical protein PHALS_11463 [Plasmopara halstedii]
MKATYQIIIVYSTKLQTPFLLHYERGHLNPDSKPRRYRLPKKQERIILVRSLLNWFCM